MLKFLLQFSTLDMYLKVPFISCLLKYSHTDDVRERLRPRPLDVASIDSAPDGVELLQMLLQDMLLLVFVIIAGTMRSRTKK